MPRQGPFPHSPAYGQSVADSTAHHARSKTFSGSLVLPHAEWLVAMSKRLGAHSMLDYGCGKGVQYSEEFMVDDGLNGLLSHTLEQMLGYNVDKFDPAWPPFSEPPAPEAKFDIVVLSHVLFWIPTDDLWWVLRRCMAHANKAIFITEKVGDEKKRFLTDRDAHPRGLHAIDWIDLIMPVREEFPEVECHLATSYRTAAERLVQGRWVL